MNYLTIFILTNHFIVNIDELLDDIERYISLFETHQTLLRMRIKTELFFFEKAVKLIQKEVIVF